MRKLTLLALTMALAAVASIVSFADEVIDFRNGETSFSYSGLIGDSVAVLVKDSGTNRKLYIARAAVSSTVAEKSVLFTSAGLSYRPKSSIWDNGTFVNLNAKAYYSGNAKTLFLAEIDGFVPVSSHNKGFANYELGIAQRIGDTPVDVSMAHGRNARKDYFKLGTTYMIPSTNLSLSVNKYMGGMDTWSFVIYLYGVNDIDSSRVLRDTL